MRAKLPKLIPTPEQQVAIDKTVAEKSKAVLNASTMGAGKSVMGVESALGINAQTVLVIGPLNTYWGWYDTLQRQTGYDEAMTITQINSSTKGKQALADLKADKSGWYFIGREYSRTIDWTGFTPDMVIVDEAHFIQNRNSKSFKSLMKLKAGFKLSMSGTPFGNRFEGAWAVTRWLWPSVIPKSFWAWAFEWCNLGYSPFSKYEITGELIPGKFVQALPCYIRLEPEHNITMVEEVRYVDLLPAQRKIYDKFQKDAVVWLDENPMIAELPIVVRARLRQIALAVPSLTAEDEVVFADDAKSTKFQALKEIIDDNPNDSMLVLTDSQKYARLVVSRLGADAFEWSGKANQTQREEAKQKFLKKQIKYIVAVIPAIAEGVDGLQDVCSTVVWLSHSDSNILNEQVLARINRRGQKETVKVYDIIARDTEDDPQADTLLKRKIQMRESLKKEK